MQAGETLLFYCWSSKVIIITVNGEISRKLSKVEKKSGRCGASEEVEQPTWRSAATIVAINGTAWRGQSRCWVATAGQLQPPDQHQVAWGNVDLGKPAFATQTLCCSWLQYTVVYIIYNHICQYVTCKLIECGLCYRTNNVQETVEIWAPGSVDQPPWLRWCAFGLQHCRIASATLPVMTTLQYSVALGFKACWSIAANPHAIVTVAGCILTRTTPLSMKYHRLECVQVDTEGGHSPDGPVLRLAIYTLLEGEQFPARLCTSPQRFPDDNGAWVVLVTTEAQTMSELKEA